MGLVFSDQLIDVNRKISIQVKDASLDEALSKLLAGTKVTFEIKNNKIYFIEKSGPTVRFPKEKVSGVVKDATGEPIIGANVVEKGVGTNGVITNLDGEFTLEVPENASLIISYIGYLQQDVSTKGKDAFNIIMKEDTKTLDEVVVVGYGVQKKVNLTGAVAAVDSKSLQNRPVTNVSNAIQGLLPGVTVISGTGQPGNDNTTIRVRGVGTLNNSNPMYVVDGLPVSSINEVDPSDIENISVLKDASSAAIYGSRAANGVILITTKKEEIKLPRFVMMAMWGGRNLRLFLNICTRGNMRSCITKLWLTKERIRSIQMKRSKSSEMVRILTIIRIQTGRDYFIRPVCSIATALKFQVVRIK